MSEQGQDEQDRTVSLGLEHYVFVLRKQWRVMVLILVLSLVVSGAYLLLTPRLATATTTLNLNVITTEPFNPQRPASGMLDEATEADIARSHVVAVRAAELLGEDTTAAEVREAAGVSTSPGATVVKVSFSAPTEQEAIDGANAVAEAYLEFRSDQATERISTILAMLSEQVDTLNEALLEANATIARTETDTEQIQATTQQQQILTELESLLSERNLLRSVDTTSGIVLSAAENNTVQFLPARTRILLTGIAAGVVLGVIGAFVRNAFDHRVRSTRELSRLLRAPALTEPGGQGAATAEISRTTLRIARERVLAALASTDDTLLILDLTTHDPPSEVSQRLHDLLEESGRGLEVIIRNTEDPAEILEALRLVTGVVLIFDMKTTRIETVNWLRREITASDTLLIGFIQVAEADSVTV